jgi:mannose-6-phosphate isomerase-like protein (cupin superfamily)
MLLLSLVLAVTSPEPYATARLLEQAKPLVAQATASKEGVAVLVLQKHPGSFTEIVVRVKSGQAEQHAEWADFMIALEGEATIVVGGELVGGKETKPGEIRGPEIRGGERYRLAPGEMLRIPPGVPHRALLADGTTCKYLVLKLADKTENK